VEPASRSLANRLAFSVIKRLASVLLPLGFGLGEFVMAAKAAFVEAAAEQIARRGNRASTARIAVVTGLSRAEVARIRSNPQDVSRPFAKQRTERVMYGWFTDPRFVDSGGNPRALAMTGQDSFEELVRKYSGDIPRRAVLEELLAGGMAEVAQSGPVSAIRRHYVLSSGRATTDLEGLAADADVFFRSATAARDGAGSTVRRIAVQFPTGIPISVRRTVALRTERFLEALADFLHAESSLTDPQRRHGDVPGTVFQFMITQCETDDLT